MTPLLVSVAVAVATFVLARGRAASFALESGVSIVTPGRSQPVYHGAFAASTAAIPGVVVGFLWLVFGESLVNWLALAPLAPDALSGGGLDPSLVMNEARNVAAGHVAPADANPLSAEIALRLGSVSTIAGAGAIALAAGASVGGALLGLRRIGPTFAARLRVESMVRAMLAVCSVVAILVTIGIVLSLIFETVRFFGHVSPFEFLFGLHWSPQTALRADQVGSSGAFGAVPLFTGTMLITAIAMSVAGPIGLLSAVYLNFYASFRVRGAIKPMLEILAGVPTVVYGYFAAISVAPFLRDLGASLGLSVASESALAAGLVMGIMIIPFVSSLSDDAIVAVPDSLRDGSYGLGATRSETIRLVMIPAALPGIMGGILLAFSRAIGETMIVVMAAGLAANLTVNPLDAVTTVTAQIVALLTGDQEFDSPKTLSAFALGLVLFLVTLSLNVIALRVVKRYRETYE